MEVRLPRLGEKATSGTVVSILVKEKERVRKDQTIMEVESEKAVIPIPSPADGVVEKIHVREGDEVFVGQLLVTLATEAEEAEGPVRSEVKEPLPHPAASQEQETPASFSWLTEPAPAEVPVASPSIRKMARWLGIDLRRVRGSGRGGRILLEDVRNYIQRLQHIAFAQAEIQKPEGRRIEFSKWGPIRTKPMSNLRRTIASRMQESWQTIPHVTQNDEADITDLLALRKKYLKAYEQHQARLTITAFVLKAVVKVLQKHPIFNASLDEASHQIVYKDYIHLAVAVDTEHGLIAPVIRNADRKNLLELSRELPELAQRTRERKLKPEELEGGTFTISNLGGIGGTHFTPIIFKPQAAVLGIGQSRQKAVVDGGRMEPRMIMPLVVSYDHRLIDGADAARFISDLVKALEAFPEDEVKL